MQASLDWHTVANCPSILKNPAHFLALFHIVFLRDQWYHRNNIHLSPQHGRCIKGERLWNTLWFWETAWPTNPLMPSAENRRLPARKRLWWTNWRQKAKWEWCRTSPPGWLPAATWPTCPFWATIPPSVTPDDLLWKHWASASPWSRRTSFCAATS